MEFEEAEIPSVSSGPGGSVHGDHGSDCRNSLAQIPRYTVSKCDFTRWAANTGTKKADFYGSVRLHRDEFDVATILFDCGANQLENLKDPLFKRGRIQP